MSIGKIREIGKDTSAQDLLDLVVGERVLLKGFGTDTQEEAGVIVWNPCFSEEFLVALRSDRNSNLINCQLYSKSTFECVRIRKSGLEEDIKRWSTIETQPGHSFSYENTEFTRYNSLLENVDL
jgi:hypothetical protein